VIIALDATPLTVPTGGVARYTFELARALARRFPDHEYWLLSDRPFPMPDSTPANLYRGGGPRNAFERRWWLWGLHREMMRRGVRLFHGVDFSVPYLPFRPSVMTVHDLSPWIALTEQPWQPDAGRVRRRTAMLLRARIPTMVITPTEVIRHAVIDHFNFPSARVVAVPLAASEHFRPVSCAPSSDELPSTHYFLFVGTLEPRKNIPVLIDAWREVRARGTHNGISIDLVIAGRTRSDFPAIAPEPGLRLIGAVPDQDLPGLYSNALAVIYPSLYEGFGLPVIEAMQCGAIVVASRDPAIMEAAGDGAILIDAHDAHGLAEVLTSITRSPEAFAPLRERALARANQFSWRRTAELTQDVYDAALRMKAKAGK
jgi:glycosyltransferase involved in cell wall biosynthesis